MIFQEQFKSLIPFWGNKVKESLVQSFRDSAKTFKSNNISSLSFFLNISFLLYVMAPDKATILKWIRILTKLHMQVTLGSHNIHINPNDQITLDHKKALKKTTHFSKLFPIVLFGLYYPKVIQTVFKNYETLKFSFLYI